MVRVNARWTGVSAGASGLRSLSVPTVPSKSAIEIADRLTLEGFTNVSAGLVQRWRERNLLGVWEHQHAGGPGSTANPATGAYDRARILARLDETDRTYSTVVFLAFLTGAHVTADEVAVAVGETFGPPLRVLSTIVGGDAADKADAALAQLLGSRRQRDRIRRYGEKLDGTPDPLWQPDEPDRPTRDRAAMVMSAFLAALGGDASWLPLVYPDALRMYGMEDVVEAAELDDPMALAALAPDMTNAVDASVDALRRVHSITEEDVEVARQSIWLLAGPEIVAELASEIGPIIEPENLLGLILGPLLSQLAEPGALHAALLEHRSQGRSGSEQK